MSQLSIVFLVAMLGMLTVLLVLVASARWHATSAGDEPVRICGGSTWVRDWMAGCARRDRVPDVAVVPAHPADDDGLFHFDVTAIGPVMAGGELRAPEVQLTCASDGLLVAVSIRRAAQAGRSPPWLPVTSLRVVCRERRFTVRTVYCVSDVDGIPLASLPQPHGAALPLPCTIRHTAVVGTN